MGGFGFLVHFTGGSRSKIHAKKLLSKYVAWDSRQPGAE